MKALKNSKHTILGIDKKSNCDISDAHLFFKTVLGWGKPDLIVHLAATCSTQKSIDNPYQDFKDNVIATFNVCELAKDVGSKLIYISSCKAKPNKYGSRAPYGLSKYIGELYTQEYALDFGLKYIINRPGTVYGPGQENSPESGWLSWFMRASKENLPITILGDGQQSRDVLYVSDIIDLLVDQIENFDKYKGRVYEIGGGLKNEITLLQALDFLKYKNYSFGPERIGDVKRFVSDNKLANSINGWKPKINWKNGIKETITKT